MLTDKMTTDKSGKCAEQATRARASRDFTEAGEFYRKAAEALMNKDDWPLNADPLEVGQELYYLLHSSICYRLADELKSCQDRCLEGIEVAEKVRDHVTNEDPEKGVTYEYIGDFRVVGDIGDYEEAYRSAALFYGDVPFDNAWEGDPLFDWNLKFFEEIMAASGFTEPEFVEWRFAFVTRLHFKSVKFPQVVELLVKKGMWD